MKKLNIKVLSLFVAAAGIFASCSQEELTKAEADKNLFPSAKIELSEITLGNVGTTTAELVFDIQNYTSEILEIAVVYSKTPDFASTSVVMFNDSVEGETVNLLVKGLDMETTYYATAYAYMRGATAYSDTVSFTTTAEPITKENLNNVSFVANGVVDVWGDAHNFDFTIVAFEGDVDSVYVCNFDPFFFANGFTAANGKNIFAGALAISEDGSTATITCASGQSVGYSDAIFLGYDPSAADGEGAFTEEFVLNLTNNGAAGSLTPGYAVYTAAQNGCFSKVPAFNFARK